MCIDTLLIYVFSAGSNSLARIKKDRADSWLTKQLLSTDTHLCNTGIYQNYCSQHIGTHDKFRHMPSPRREHKRLERPQPRDLFSQRRFCVDSKCNCTFYRLMCFFVNCVLVVNIKIAWILCCMKRYTCIGGISLSCNKCSMGGASWSVNMCDNIFDVFCNNFLEGKLDTILLVSVVSLTTNKMD